MSTPKLRLVSATSDTSMSVRGARGAALTGAR